jgi:aminotransferase
MATEVDAIDLGQGLPDFDPPRVVQDAAVDAIRSGSHQYSPTWGHLPLREKLAEQYTESLGWHVDPALNVTITCGVTEAICSALLALLNPGDQVLIIEPSHENFIPAAIFAAAEPVAVTLQAPDYRLDYELLAEAITPRSRVLLLNTPHNPTGRVFDTEEIASLIDLVLAHNLLVVTDEIYDQILYDGRQHHSPGAFEALRERTVTIGGLGKTFAITGWRVGYAIAPTQLAAALRPVHDFLTICAPTPLQVAAVTALNLPKQYYDVMLSSYHKRRDLMMDILDSVGFRATTPEGSYYVLADYRNLPIPQAKWDSNRFAIWMLNEIGVAVLPGSIFYSLPGHGEHSLRFAFPKKLETLRVAKELMCKMQV